jgi:hypothetical protein
LTKIPGSGKLDMDKCLSFKLTNNSKVRFFDAHNNTFSISQGRVEDGGTCVHATEACLKVCYDATLRRIYKHYRANEDYNKDLVWEKPIEEQVEVISNSIKKWYYDTGRMQPFFRIHTGGEFFNENYANAWRTVIDANQYIHFWVYTRSLFAVPILAGLKNLTLLLSCDVDNKDEVLETYKVFKTHPNISVAWMGNEVPPEFPKDRSLLVCPEVTGKTKTLNKQGACSRCRACIDRTLKSGDIRHIQFPIHR